MIIPGRVIEDLKLRPFGGKGWYSSDSISCPECGKLDKFGFIFSNGGGAVHCFKCDFSESMYHYLKRIDKAYLIKFEKEVSINQTLKPLGKVDEEIKELQEVPLPKGFIEICYDPYLEERGFRHYKEFRPGITTSYIERSLHGYIIYQIFQGGKRVAWIARSKRTKEWHEKNIEDFKEGRAKLKLRYRNSTGVDFGHILGGIDEVTDDTHTAFIVEGLFDMTHLSDLLKTDESPAVKVLFTFGNKISNEQIDLLRKTKLQTIILMYDANTLSQTKHYSTILSKWFETFVCYIDDQDVDPGNMTQEYLHKILLDMKNSFYFYSNKIQKNLGNGKSHKEP